MSVTQGQSSQRLLSWLERRPSAGGPTLPPTQPMSSVHVGHYLPVRLAALVNGGQTAILTYAVEFTGKVISMRFRVYLGNQLSLQVTPVVIHNDAAQPLIRFGQGGVTYLAGDDETDDYRMAAAVVPGDVIQVTAVNTDPTNAYNFACNFELVREA